VSSFNIVSTNEMAERVRRFDWSATPLGPIETWSRSLTSYVNMILELPSPAIIFWGPDQTQIYNEGYAVIMGPRHPRYLGASYRECWPDTYPLIYPWMRKVLDHGDVICVEKRHITVTRHGFAEEAFFTFTFSPLRDDEGNICGIYQPVVEVTDTVLSERRAETLRALASRPDSPDPIKDVMQALSANFHDLPCSLIYLRDDSGMLRRVAHSNSLAGVDVGCLDEIACSAFRSNLPVHIDDLDQRLGGAHIGPWPEPTRSAHVYPVRGAEASGPRGVVVFGTSARLAFDDKYRGFLELAAGQVVSAIVAAQALHDAQGRAEMLSRAQAAAEIEREKLYAIFSEAPASIVILRGRDMILELANHAALEVWGRDETILGKPLLEALPELTDQSFSALLDEVFRTGVPYRAREAIARLDRRGDGIRQEVYFDFVYEPMRDPDGSIQRILVFAVDVTDRVEARRRIEGALHQAQTANRTKDEFLAMLGHELRNPLAPIMTALDIMRLRGDYTAERERSVIERQVHHLVGLVDDLLDVSRITRGKIELNRTRVELAEVVGRAIEMASPLIEQRQHDVTIAVAPIGLLVDADVARMAQVVANLLTNAAKYTEPGGHITVAASRENDEVVLRVRDTGIGIPAETLPHVFDLFTQERQALDRSQGGLGLGLAIVRSLVALHGGSVSVQSEGRGKGTELTVRLPAMSPLAAVSTEQGQNLSAEPRDAGRALVVDDNADAAEMLGAALERYGWQVRIAHDGPTALRVVEDWVPQLALLDIGLPVMDGYELARRLRELPQTKDAKLIAVTGYGQERDRELSLAAGFDKHLVKPIKFNMLESVMAEYP
jgi:PAS domain S-box-containing protein